MKTSKPFLLFFLVLSGICSSLTGQENKTIDSLLGVLNTAIDDTNKVILLDDISYEYSGISFDKSIHYANLELELSKKLNYKLGIAAAYTSMGIANELKGDYPAALGFYIKSMKIKEESGNKVWIASSYNNIANIYNAQGDYDKAIEYFSKLIEAKDLIKSKVSEGNAYNNIGIVYKNKKEYEKSIQFHLLGLQARKEAGFPKAIAASYNNIGVTYQDMKEYDKSITAFNEALKIRKPLNDLHGIAGTNVNIGKTYNLKKEFDKALPYLIEGEKYTVISGNNNFRLNAYANLADCFDGLKDHKNQSSYLLKYIALNDSVYNNEKSAQIISMQTKFDTERKENDNKLLLQQNQIQQLQISRSSYMIAGISIVLLLVVVIGFLFFRQSRLNSQQQTMQLEQKLLRSQMNPHFIFNSLTAIESYIYKNEPKEAGKYLSSFARLMRLILENSREEFIPLSKEIQTLEYYLQLQQNRFDNTFSYTIEIADGLDPEAVAIPPMLAQPFIENSIEHGLRNMDKKGEISIFFRLHNDQLIFEVKDNGIGLEKAMAVKEQNLKHRSMATTITMERLMALNRKKLNKIRFSIRDLSDSAGITTGTSVSFDIRFKEI